jgi:hypothetical protein
VYSSGYMILNGIYQTITKQSSTSFVFYNLTPNTTYTYNIGVYNAAKDLITTSGSVTTVELPTISVTSTSHTTSSITIQWSGSYSTGVLIINDSTKYTLTSSETTKTISNLTADTRYNYTINVYNTTGDVVSTNGTITTLPTISVVSAIADTSNVTITWSGRFTTGSIILDNTSYTFTSEKTSQSFSGLTSDTTYSYSITVNNSAYKSAYVHSTVTTMLFVSQLLYYKFNKTDISGNYIANYAQGSATYTDSILTSSSAISIYRYKYGTGSFCPYYGYINLPTFAFTSNGITISFWFYFTMSMSIGDQIQVFDFGNGSYKYNYICRVYSYGSSKRIYMDLHLNTNGLQMWNYTSTVCLTTSYTAGTWGHISIVCSGTNWTYYYNGSYAYKQTNVYYPTSLTRTNAMLGYNYTGDTSSISGYLDDFRVHNIALTSDQISTLYKASN